MRLAIDARLNAYRQGGIPQYTRQLLTALAEVASEDEFISLQHRDQLRPLVIAPNVTRRTVLWDQGLVVRPSWLARTTNCRASSLLILSWPEP